jgi:probable HAF family extracellular repeat protein
MTNTLVEKNQTGTVFAALRPGLKQLVDGVAVSGNGIVEFNDALFSVYGSELVISDIPALNGDGLEEINELQDRSIPVLSFSVNLSCVNTDGSVIVGAYDDGPSQQQAFRWTEAERMVPLGRLEEGKQSVAVGTNADGTRVIGFGTKTISGTARRVPFVWIQDDGIYAVAGGFNSETTINQVSRDALVFAGWRVVGSKVIGYIWKNDTITDCDSGSAQGNEFFCVSQDGDVAAGYERTATSFRFLVSKSDASYVQQNYGLATCLSDNGGIVFGFGSAASTLQGEWKPAYWTEAEGVVFLASPHPGKFTGCNSDGTVACGSINEGVYSSPFYWSSNTGMVILSDIIHEFDGNEGLYGAGNNEIVYMATDANPIVLCGVVSKSLPLDTAYIYWVWTPADGFIAIEIYAFDQLNNGPTGSYVISADGTTVASSFSSDESIAGLIRWRNGGRYRNIAALDSQFFDFAQSTL